MNLQVLRTIRSSMCPKEKWVPDRDVTNCFKCDARFNKLYRWKHHCRICGKIFCSPCCEYYIQGSDLDEEDKPLRTCQFCNRKFWAYLMEKDQDYYNRRKNDPLYASKLATMYLQERKPEKQSFQKRMNKTDDEKTSCIKALLTDFQIQGDPMPIAKLWQIAQSKLSLMLQIALKMNKISFDYYEVLQLIIKRVVSEVPANAMVTRNMNICANVKLKYEKSTDVGARYVGGTLLKAAMKSKKMPSTFENINIVLVYGSCEASDIVGVRANSFVSFEEMIENRKKDTAKIIEKLHAMSVSMVFLEGSIDRQAQDLLFSRDIVVFSKIDVNTLLKLKTSLEIGKIVEKISLLEVTDMKLYVGHSKLIYFTKVASFDGSDESALVVEGGKPCNGMTIILAGPNQTALKLIKYELKQLIRVARHMLLRIYKIMLDQDMMQSMTPEVRATLANPAVANIFFHSSLESQSTMVSYLKHRYLQHKHIVYVQSEYSPTSMPEMTKQLAEDYQRKKYRGFRSKWRYFTEICQQSSESRLAYSPDDMPLGEYVLKKLLGMNMKCQNCRKPHYQHIDVFYGPHLYTKIELESRIIETQWGSNNSLPSLDSQAMFEELMKFKDKQKIEVYIECCDCHAQLSSKFTMRQQHLELSFVTYIAHSFHVTQWAYLKYPEEQSKDGVCRHFRKCRVFQLGEYFMKIYTDFLVPSLEFKLSTEQKEEIVKRKQAKVLNELCMQFNMNLEHIAGYVASELQKIAETAKNPVLSLGLRNPKESFMKAMSCYQALGKEGGLTKSQYLQILVPEMMEHLQRITTKSSSQLSPKTCSNFLDAWRTFANYCFVLNSILRIVKFLDKSRGSDITHRLHRQSIDTTFLQDELDINSQLEEERPAFRENNHIYEFNHDVVVSTFEERGTSGEVSEIGGERCETQPFSSNSPPKIGPSFPSLMSRKLRKTESAMYQSLPTMNKEAIESILRSAVSSFGTSTYIKHIPCNSTCQAVISNALNSEAHRDAIRKNLSEIVIRLTSEEVQFTSESEQLRKLNSILEAHQKGLDMPKPKKFSTENYTEVTVLFPKEFSIVRQSRGISIESFIGTIVGTDLINSEGKSGSYVLQSYNELQCLRILSEGQFQSLYKFLPKYFKHIEEPTLLVQIYGAYEIVKNSRVEFVIVMQNMFFGMDQWEIYDFKGMMCRRFSRPPQIPMDMNFVLDRNSQPLFSSKDVLLNLKRTVEFLAENGLTDYSLTLIMNIEDASAQYLDGSKIRLGISNYIREDGMGERITKAVMNIGNSSNDATAYAERLYRSVRRYFWTILED